MIDYSIVILPCLFAIAALFIKKDNLRRMTIPIAAVIHFILTLMIVMHPHDAAPEAWIYFGKTGKFFLVIASILFLMTSFYTYNYLRKYEEEHPGATNRKSESIFIACMLVFFSTISLVTGAQNIGLLWVGMEATTLASAPLIYFNRSRYSLEATWKYLLICSVGIGLALLGNIFVEMSFYAGNIEPSLFIRSLVNNAHSLNPVWLKTAFIFFLIGYGTKMGLAPMHTWLPDAHSEAPAMISALMSGTLLNCGLLGILRIHQVLVSAGIADYGRGLFIIFGLISLFIAAIFIVGQTDFKRMLAYSSIENMGIIAFGIGLGGEAVYGAFLQILNHSFIKGALFLLAGNIYLHYRTRKISEVSGVIKALPITGILWFACFLAINAVPPFGSFISEFLIIKHAIFSKQYLAIIIFILLLIIIFTGMSFIFIRTCFGNCQEKTISKERESLAAIIPPLILTLSVLFLGLYLPSWLDHTIKIISSYIQ